MGIVVGVVAAIAVGVAIGIILGNAFSKPKVENNYYVTNTYNDYDYSTLYMPCCVCEGNRTSQYYYHECGNRIYFNYKYANLRCNFCEIECAIWDYHFQCEKHARAPYRHQSLLYSLQILGSQAGKSQQMMTAIKRLSTRPYK